MTGVRTPAREGVSDPSPKRTAYRVSCLVEEVEELQFRVSLLEERWDELASLRKSRPEKR